MTEVKLFECDVTGDRFGARNDVVEIGVKRRWSHRPFDVHDYSVHLSDAAIEEHGQRIPELQHIRYVAMNDDEIVGCATSSGDGTPEYRERGDVVVDRHEEVFEFLEEEVIT